MPQGKSTKPKVGLTSGKRKLTTDGNGVSSSKVMKFTPAEFEQIKEKLYEDHKAFSVCLKCILNKHY